MFFEREISMGYLLELFDEDLCDIKTSGLIRETGVDKIPVVVGTVVFDNVKVEGRFGKFKDFK